MVLANDSVDFECVNDLKCVDPPSLADPFSPHLAWQMLLLLLSALRRHPSMAGIHRARSTNRAAPTASCTLLTRLLEAQVS